ncbi:MAG TPA: hypothetical protein VK416_03870, partial [Thermoanaerobaculia bacterium]|nr:hypothetical protein [Thermoanaerobaculia bacterium]
EDEFRRGSSIPVEILSGDAAEIPDRPRLTLVVDPETEWSGDGPLPYALLNGPTNVASRPASTRVLSFGASRNPAGICATKSSSGSPGGV